VRNRCRCATSHLQVAVSRSVCVSPPSVICASSTALAAPRGEERPPLDASMRCAAPIWAPDARSQCSTPLHFAMPMLMASVRPLLKQVTRASLRKKDGTVPEGAVVRAGNESASQERTATAPSTPTAASARKQPTKSTARLRRLLDEGSVLTEGEVSGGENRPRVGHRRYCATMRQTPCDGRAHRRLTCHP